MSRSQTKKVKVNNEDKMGLFYFSLDLLLNPNNLLKLLRLWLPLSNSSGVVWWLESFPVPTSPFDSFPTTDQGRGRDGVLQMPLLLILWFNSESASSLGEIFDRLWSKQMNECGPSIVSNLTRGDLRSIAGDFSMLSDDLDLGVQFVPEVKEKKRRKKTHQWLSFLFVFLMRHWRKVVAYPTKTGTSTFQ